MYIAFKWLLGLNLLLWTAMCSLDIILKKNKDEYAGDCDINVKITKDDNITLLVKPRAEDQHNIHHTNYESLLHYITFFAGILAVSLFNRKREIISYTKSIMVTLNSYVTATKYIKETDLKSIATKLTDILMVHTKIILAKLQAIPVALKTLKADKQRKGYLILLRKLKEIEEHRNLGQLLIAAIRENKIIRAQYQLESMAKDRLMRHVENTQRFIKENRSKYVSIQQLYLITHQENIFLKARVVKLTKDKEEVKRNLSGLVNEVYQSKNNELKAYCSRFIVNTKHNLLNMDAKAEIRKFLQQSIQSTSTVAWKFHEPYDIDENNRNFPKISSINEVLQENFAFVPVVSEAPKLRGLPGEYVWTVKDKDGIIEKLYECAYDSDNGDVIRRIRQYSVYYDKDCLLDFVNSKTVIQEIDNSNYFQSHHINVEYPIATHRFLTGSEAFRRFLEKLRNIISFSSSSAPPLTYDL